MASQSTVTKRIAGIPAESLKERLNIIVDGMYPANVGLAVILIAELGLRANEVCGLSWADVDLEAKTVHVGHAHGNSEILKELKAADRRTMPLTPVAYESFVRLHDHHELIRRLYKRDFLGSDTAIICDAFGKHMRPQTISRWWRFACAEFPIYKWTLADVRSARLAINLCEAEAGR